MASVDSIGRPPEVGRGLAPAADALVEALALAVAGGTLEAAWMGTAAFGDALAEAPALAVLLALEDAVTVADALADDPCAWATLANNNIRATAHAAHARAAIHFRCSRTGKCPHHCSSALAMHPHLSFLRVLLLSRDPEGYTILSSGGTTRPSTFFTAFAQPLTTPLLEPT
jgi:hypothetical protein